MSSAKQVHPQHPRHLVGSKWTAVSPENKELHWTVEAFAPKRKVVTLLAVLTGARRELPWRDLRDRAVWLPGWVQPSARRVLVVGAGFAGLACARGLADAGLNVTVVDKGRGPGGRASTRRADERRFDHGAQYFTVRDEAFRERVAEWEEAGAVARWEPRQVRLAPGAEPEVLEARCVFVGVPGMSSLIRHLAVPLAVDYGVRVTGLRREGEEWFADCEEGEPRGPFARVVVATPSAQAVALLSAAPRFAERAADVVAAPCWAGLVAFDGEVPVDWQAARVPEGSALRWVCDNGSKPDRPSDCWVLHAGPEWSAEHLEDDKESVARALLEAFAELAGELPAPAHLNAHRWRYALVTESMGVDCLWDPGLGVGVCGDGCRGGRVEDAFLSGRALAERMVQKEGQSA